jgi:serine/threonine protein kinase
LKPAKILLDEHNNVKLCDFGLATTLIKLKRRTGTSDTEGYIAPEVYKCQPEVNKEIYGVKIDTWSLGVCMYRFL